MRLNTKIPMVMLDGDPMPETTISGIKRDMLCGRFIASYLARGTGLKPTELMDATVLGIALSTDEYVDLTADDTVMIKTVLREDKQEVAGWAQSFVAFLIEPDALQERQRKRLLTLLPTVFAGPYQLPAPTNGAAMDAEDRADEDSAHGEMV